MHTEQFGAVMDLGSVDWEKLKVCLAVAQAGSMAAAAQRLGESQATISRKVDDVENRLGTELFLRSPRGIQLTDAGRNAVNYIQIMWDAVENLQTNLSSFDTLPKGSVSITASDGLGAHWIAPRLPEFHRQFPDIDLIFDVVDDVGKLGETTSDISVQFAPPQNRELIQARIGRLHYIHFASPAYIKTYGAPKNVLDLTDHRTISHSGYVNQPEKWPDKGNAYRELIDPKLLTNSGAVMREVCAAGGGIALLPSYFAEVDERLVPLGLDFTVPIDFWLVYPERTRQLTRGRVTIEWVKSLFDTATVPWFRPTYVAPKRPDDGPGRLQVVQEPK